MATVSDGRGGRREAGNIPAITVGTMVSTDLDRARRFYEEFLGFECVRCSPDRMLIRDKGSAELVARGDPGAFVIDVRAIDRIDHPQGLLNHWGFSVASKDEVDRIREVALAQAEAYGIEKVNPITKMHGTYQFYFFDVDKNWWEIEFRGEDLRNERVFEKGDYKRD